MIVIADYGMGNLHSVLKAFRRLRVDAVISNNPEEIINADKLILPGVGNFKRGMKNLKEMNLIDPLNTAVLEKNTPILGICLGMQLMTKYSEEGNTEGLGWIDAETIRFDFSQYDNSFLHIPHIGWNNAASDSENLLFKNLDHETTFYFIHSYYVNCKQEDTIAAVTKYGNTFVSAISKNNIFATQFHPEKSHDSGLNLLKNFIDRT
ncbi:MAG TPA: imidazole glycerol phosphate synthase subunit HisH [Flavobacteriales bacterium]|nr:imidazole glycerol phosphate synthase subunit HisH [Flavobacteriales bacterium]